MTARCTFSAVVLFVSCGLVADGHEARDHRAERPDAEAGLEAAHEGLLGRWWSDRPWRRACRVPYRASIRYRGGAAVNPLNTPSAPGEARRPASRPQVQPEPRRAAHRGGRGALSRAQLAKLTGLNKTTVSSLVAELIERGVVTESGLADGGGVGRPAQILELDDSRIAALGLEINVDYVAVCVCDLRGAVRFRDGRRARQPRELAEARLRGARGARRRGARRMRRARPDADRRRHLGAGHGRGRDGHADPRAQPRLGSAAGRRDACATRSATRRSRSAVGNDANLAALGELESGALRGIRDGLLIYGNIGIGGAVIVDGAIFPGSDGFAGEIGHIPVRPFDGERCRCGGRGCLETLAGQEAIARRVGIQGTRNETSSPAELVAERARSGDPRVIARARRGRRVPRHLHRRGGLARQPAAGRPGRRARDARALAPARRARRRGPAHDGRSDGSSRSSVRNSETKSAIRGGAALVLHRRAERSDLRPGTRPGALTDHPAAKPPD